ncbi:hypothetical protein BH24ACT3_BH24ACT3_19550 [soil metagenome]
MTVLVILIVLALLFGAGAVIEGLAWLFIISVVLIAAAVFFGYRALAGR